MATITNPGPQSALSDYPLVVDVVGTLADEEAEITWGLEGNPAGVSITSTGADTARITFQRKLLTTSPTTVELTITADEDETEQDTEAFVVTLHPRSTSPAILAAVGAI